MLACTDDTQVLAFEVSFLIFESFECLCFASVTHCSSTRLSAALRTQAPRLFSPLLHPCHVSELQSARSAAVLLNPVPTVIMECLEGHWCSPPYGFTKLISHTLKKHNCHISVIMLHIFSCLFFSLHNFFFLDAFLETSPSLCSFHKCSVFFSLSLSPMWPLCNCTWWNAIKQRINLLAVQRTGSPLAKAAMPVRCGASRPAGSYPRPLSVLLSHEAFWARQRRRFWETATAAFRRDEDTGCFGSLTCLESSWNCLLLVRGTFFFLVQVLLWGLRRGPPLFALMLSTLIHLESGHGKKGVRDYQEESSYTWSVRSYNPLLCWQ